MNGLDNCKSFHTTIRNVDIISALIEKPNHNQSQPISTHQHITHIHDELTHHYTTIQHMQNKPSRPVSVV